VPLIILPSAYGDAATNMAVDASLLYTLPKSISVFRHYGWTEPAITFGYTQAYAEVLATSDKDIYLCRRITGGGIVDHRNDWTYALVIQAARTAPQAPAVELYETIHRCIQTTLNQLSVPSQLAPCPRACGQTPYVKKSGANQCFVQPAANDVIRPDGVKIAGAAMKRSREGLLVQGSIDRAALPENFDFTSFAKNLPILLSEQLDIPIGASEDLRALFNGPRIQEERQRFASDTWKKKR
jgi:lipoyl(octanoyl) transferase